MRSTPWIQKKMVLRTPRFGWLSQNGKFDSALRENYSPSAVTRQLKIDCITTEKAIHYADGFTQPLEIYNDIGPLEVYLSWASNKGQGWEGTSFSHLLVEKTHDQITRLINNTMLGRLTEMGLL